MNKKGQVLVIAALVLFALMGLAALGIDVGYLYSTRHELQRSADSGALAGASAFLEGPWDGLNLASPTMVLADTRARDFAAPQIVVTSALDRNSEVLVSFPSQDRIRVTTQRVVPMFFARVFGMQTRLVTATAVAEAAIADTSVNCLKPWGVPKPWNDNTFGDGDPRSGNQKYDPGEDVIEFDEMGAGYQVILKVGEPFNNPNNLDNVSSLQQESGHFFALDLCGTGGSNYRDRIQNEICDCPINLGEEVNLKTGNTVGPTRQGVDVLMDDDPFAQWTGGDPPVENSSHPNWRDSLRLVKVPIYDPDQMLHTGNVNMTVDGFAGFWLEGYNTQQGTVIGRYVPDDVLGGSTSGPGPGPSLKVLRLCE